MRRHITPRMFRQFSDDDEPLKGSSWEDMMLMGCFLSAKREKRKRRKTKDHRPTFWEQTVPSYSDDDFVNDFRMSRNLFLWLCSTLKEQLRKVVQGKVS